MNLLFDLGLTNPIPINITFFCFSAEALTEQVRRDHSTRNEHAVAAAN